MKQQTQPPQPKVSPQQTQKNQVQEWALSLLKIRDEEEKRQFEKFRKEELARIQMEKEEDERQEKERKEAIRLANQKFFMDDERVTGLHSAMQYCDVLEERKNQLALKQ